MFYIKKLIDWALPYCCILCGAKQKKTRNICHACQHDLPILPQGCKHCANIIFDYSSGSCGQCLQNQPPFNATHALFDYQAPIDKLILNLKFHHALANATLLGELLTEKIVVDWYQHKTLPTAIIPIPLHKKRLKERGFNQAIEIARPIAKKLKIPLLINHCGRLKSTLPQATLSSDLRQNNIRGAFEVIRPIAHQHVAIVDDVITTGNTITEICRELKKAGVNNIDVWACAKVIL